MIDHPYSETGVSGFGFRRIPCCDQPAVSHPTALSEFLGRQAALEASEKPEYKVACAACGDYHSPCANRSIALAEEATKHAIALRAADAHWASFFREKWLAAMTQRVAERQALIALRANVDPQPARVFDGIYNSVLDSESDPNPEVADDERDRWLIYSTWLSTLNTIIDMTSEG